MNYLKTTKTAYNNTTQAFEAEGTTIQLLGNIVLNSGCSANVVNNGFAVNKSGIYRISYDVTFTPTATGDAIVQLYEDNNALPCAIATSTVVTANNVLAMHVETTIYIGVCACLGNKNISAKISGVVGDINHVCANITKVA